MPQGPCMSCGGAGYRQVPRSDENGNTVYVNEPCSGCGGTGQQELPA